MGKLRLRMVPELAMTWKECITCHGNGTIKKIKNGVTTEETCPACKGAGGINTGNI